MPGIEDISGSADGADGFALPFLTEWQRVVLARAVRFVGSPYVWAGTSERPQPLLGKRLIPDY